MIGRTLQRTKVLQLYDIWRNAVPDASLWLRHSSEDVMTRAVFCLLLVGATACADAIAPPGRRFAAGEFPVADLVDGSAGPHYLPLRSTLGGRSAATPRALNITYHGGRVLSSPNVAIIYWSRRTIYTGGPAVNTFGPGSADGSLVGYWARNLGTSAY